MITTGKDSLYFTIFDALTDTFSTLTITEETDIQALQELIKEKYGKIAQQDDR